MVVLDAREGPSGVLGKDAKLVCASGTVSVWNAELWYTSAMHSSENPTSTDTPPTPESAAIRQRRKHYRSRYTLPKEAASALIQRIKNRPALHSPERKEFRTELEALYASLDSSIDTLMRDLEWQQRYGLVQHTRVHSAGELAEKLAHGVHTIEFDVRGTKDDVPVVAHSLTGEGTVGFFGKGLHEMSLSEADREIGDVLSLEEAFTLFETYKENHELIVEIKDESMVDEVADLIKRFQLEQCVRVASLIPDVIKKMHDMCPGVGLVLNAGVVPYFDMPILDDPHAITPKQLLPFGSMLEDVRTKGWSMMRIGRLTVVVSAGIDHAEEGVSIGPDDDKEGRGEQRAYIFFRLPDEIAEILRANPERNAASISMHCLVGNIAKIFAPKTGRAIVERVARDIESLDIPTLGALGLTSLAPAVKNLDAEEQVRALRSLGVKLIYTDKDPVAIAEALQDESEKAA